MFWNTDAKVVGADGGVVGTRVRHRHDLSNTHKRFCTVWNYYNTLAADDRPPCKADFDPSEIARALPYVNMMDVVFEQPSTPEFRFRVVGTAQTGWANMDPTGQRLHEVLPEDRAERLSETLHAVVRDEAPWLFKTPLPFDQREHVLIDVLHLPFRGAEAAVGFILSVFGYPGYEFG